MSFHEFINQKKPLYMSFNGSFSETKTEKCNEYVIAYIEPTSIPEVPFVVRAYETEHGDLYINALDGSGFQEVTAKEDDTADRALYRAYRKWDMWCMENQRV